MMRKRYQLLGITISCLLGLSNNWLYALCEPEDLAGTCKVFKTDYKHFSPMYGYIYYQHFIRGLYFGADDIKKYCDEKAKDPSYTMQPLTLDEIGTPPQMKSPLGQLAQLLFYSPPGDGGYHILYIAPSSIQFPAPVVAHIVHATQQVIDNEGIQDKEKKEKLKKLLESSEGLLIGKNVFENNKKSIDSWTFDNQLSDEQLEIMRKEFTQGEKSKPKKYEKKKEFDDFLQAKISTIKMGSNASPSKFETEKLWGAYKMNTIDGHFNTIKCVRNVIRGWSVNDKFDSQSILKQKDLKSFITTYVEACAEAGLFDAATRHLSSRNGIDPYTPIYILTASLCEKYSNAESLQDYCKKLFELNNAYRRPNAASGSQNMPLDAGAGTSGEGSSEHDTAQNASVIDDDRQAADYESTLIARLRKKLGSPAIPPIDGFQNVTNKYAIENQKMIESTESISFIDCGENAFRHFFQTMLYDQKTKGFDVSRLGGSGTLSPEFVEFFTKCPSPARANTPDGHNAWLKVIYSVPGIKCGQEVKRTGTFFKDLSGNLHNFMVICNHLLQLKMFAQDV